MFRRVTRPLERLASSQGKQARANVVATVLLRETDHNFSRGVDPDDKPWVKPTTGGRPLFKSGRLRRSIRADTSKRRVRLYSRIPWAHIHQNGGVIRAKRSKYLKFRIGSKFVQTKRVVIPARPFLPGRRLSRRYRNAMQEATVRNVRSLFR